MRHDKQQHESTPIQRSDDGQELQSDGQRQPVPTAEGPRSRREVREAVSWYLARGALRVAEKLVVKQQ